MNGERELRTGTAVSTAEPPHTAQQGDEVLFIDEVARELKSSVRTLKRMIRAGTFPIPETFKIDRRRRWSRAVVIHYIREGHVLIHNARKPTARLRAVPRKPAGEGVREGGPR